MTCRRNGSGAQSLIGLVLLTVGGLLFAHNLDLIDARPLWRFWPVAVLAVGLFKVVVPGSRGDKGLGIVLTVFGGAQLARVLGYWSPAPADVVALVLMTIGGLFLFRGVFGRAAPEVPRDAGETLSAFAVLAGFERTSNSQNFRGGELTAVMGGCEIDLRMASMRAPAVIDVFAMWGGIEIRVPDDWTVELNGTPLLGGFVDNSRPPAMPTDKRLIVRGVALMAGVEVKN